jgi:ubiquinone/menaquinone biosynthesis C-methylase UbiE
MTNEEPLLPQEFFFRVSGSGDSLWEIHRPQSIIVKLVEQGVFQGEILDIGCGIADNAIYIANHVNNIHITAIDLVCLSFLFHSKLMNYLQVPKAIEVAREKAQKANAVLQFEVVDFIKDVSTTNLQKHSYDTVLDAAVFHTFGNDDRQVYLRNLEYLIKPGGLYILVCFSEKEIRKGGPRRIKLSDLDELFSSKNGWKIESIEDAIYESRPESILPGGVQAHLLFIRRNNT